MRLCMGVEIEEENGARIPPRASDVVATLGGGWTPDVSGSSNSLTRKWGEIQATSFS